MPLRYELPGFTSYAQGLGAGLQHPAGDVLPGSGSGEAPGNLLPSKPSGYIIYEQVLCSESDTLQVTFFLAAAVAGRLGTSSMAAHAIVSQLWMLASFVVDGFANAATVLGSRMMAHHAEPCSLGVQVCSKDPALGTLHHLGFCFHYLAHKSRAGQGGR